MALVIEDLGWRGGFLFSAGLTAVTFVPAGILLVRNSPSDVGELMDGEQQSAVPLGTESGGLALTQVLRLPLFWMLAFGLMLYFSGAVGWSLHIVPFLESRGLSRDNCRPARFYRIRYRYIGTRRSRLYR